ncbi:MAG: hypothetical protein H6821_01945 [Planctomycetaceae bacterium]|nr:hypothetical protein [Planctomycetaceae bacterium]
MVGLRWTATVRDFVDVDLRERGITKTWVRQIHRPIENRDADSQVAEV